MGQKRTNIVQSVDRALSIVEVLARVKKEIGVTEIAEIMNLHKSTTFGLLVTLERKNYVKQNKETGKYSLGLKFLELSNVIYESMDLKNIVKPYLEELANNYQETVHFAIEDVGRVVYIEKIESSRAVVIKSSIGKRNPMYCTGVGKCLLAYMSDDEISKIIKQPLLRYTNKTITDLNLLKDELKKIKENGYSIDDEEIEIGLRCIAAPVKDYKGQVIGAVSIAGPTVRMTNERIEELKKPLIRVALQISKSIGYDLK